MPAMRRSKGRRSPLDRNAGFGVRVAEFDVRKYPPSSWKSPVELSTRRAVRICAEPECMKGTRVRRAAVSHIGRTWEQVLRA